jgi:acetyl-CoA acetyltransferase
MPLEGRAVISNFDDTAFRSRLIGPSFAVEKALKRAGMTASDIDPFEWSGAFTAVVLRFMEALGVGYDKVNVNGGARIDPVTSLRLTAT